MNVLGSVAKTAYYYKKIQGFSPNWKLRYKLKCKNTEFELTNWLQNSQIERYKPIAIVAKETEAKPTNNFCTKSFIFNFQLF